MKENEAFHIEFNYPKERDFHIDFAIEKQSYLYAQLMALNDD